jgi:hypothetical protein
MHEQSQDLPANARRRRLVNVLKSLQTRCCPGMPRRYYAPESLELTLEVKDLDG